jgi:cytochrome b involved in lipid metabolism
MPFLQIIATKSYGFVHLDYSPEDKIKCQYQDQMRHHGKSVHKPGYDPWLELHNIALLLPLVEIMA